MTVNTPERSAEIVKEMTVPKLYSRAQTGLAMAKTEVWALKALLERHKLKLQSEIAEIDQVLVKASEQTDSWYDVIYTEMDIASRMDK